MRFQRRRAAIEIRRMPNVPTSGRVTELELGASHCQLPWPRLSKRRKSGPRLINSSRLDPIPLSPSSSKLDFSRAKALRRRRAIAAWQLLTHCHAVPLAPAVRDRSGRADVFDAEARDLELGLLVRIGRSQAAAATPTHTSNTAARAASAAHAVYASGAASAGFATTASHPAATA